MYLLGIDIGTSGTKTLLCDEKGTVLATATASHTLLTPKPGWSEQRPDEWWEATVLATKAVVKKAKIKASEIKAIGLSGQMHGSVFLDKGGKAVRNALLWNDQRTSRQADDILAKAGGPKQMLAMVGNLPLTGYTVPKILWLRDNEPAKYERVRAIILPKDYIRLKLTGDVASEYSDASGTALLDCKNRVWSDALLGKLNIDKTLLPKLYESTDVTGTLTATAAKELGLAAGTPVVGGGSDAATGAVGNGIVEAGLINAALGTSGVMLAHADEYRLDDADTSAIGRVATMCHAVPGKWIVFGCMLSAAGSFQWYADHFAEYEAQLAKKLKRNVFDLLTEEAAKAPIGSEGVFFLPFLTGERCPYPDPNARAAWIGMTRRTNQGTLIRSLLEGVTFNMNAILKIMRDMQVPVREIRGYGGGTKSRLWMEMQANIYDAPMTITNSQEGCAYGAALIAGVGAGAWPTLEEACRKTIKTTSRTKPNAKAVATYARHAAVYEKMYGDLKERFGEIASLG